MPNNRRLNISLRNEHAMIATRVAIGAERLVYVLVANRLIRYRDGRSRIVYIGTTRKGLARIAGSIAKRAPTILSLRGVKTFTARIVTCRPRQRVKSWKKLERALLIAFCETFGSPPRCNAQGKRMQWRDELEYFKPKRLIAVLAELS